MEDLGDEVGGFESGGETAGIRRDDEGAVVIPPREISSAGCRYSEKEEKTEGPDRVTWHHILLCCIRFVTL